MEKKLRVVCRTKRGNASSGLPSVHLPFPVHISEQLYLVFFRVVYQLSFVCVQENDNMSFYERLQGHGLFIVQ